MKVLQFLLRTRTTPTLPNYRDANLVALHRLTTTTATAGCWASAHRRPFRPALPRQRRLGPGLRAPRHPTPPWPPSSVVQDVLALGSDSRMNTPGRAGGNWAWRDEGRRATRARGGAPGRPPVLRQVTRLAWGATEPCDNACLRGVALFDGLDALEVLSSALA